MTYLLLGAQSSEKDQKIAELKKKHLVLRQGRPQKLIDDALKFDFETLYGNKLDPAEFKKSVLALPVFCTNRVILIQDIQKFSPHNKEILFEYISNGQQHVVLILDAGEVERKNSFIDKISSQAQVVRFKKAIKETVFNMAECLISNRPAEALQILSKLFAQGDHPLQLLGGLVWFWGNNRNRFSKESFRAGLHTLQETDINIKRSKLNPEQALEVAVVKLSSLASC